MARLLRHIDFRFNRSLKQADHPPVARASLSLASIEFAQPAYVAWDRGGAGERTREPDERHVAPAHSSGEPSRLRVVPSAKLFEPTTGQSEDHFLGPVPRQCRNEVNHAKVFLFK